MPTSRYFSGKDFLKRSRPAEVDVLRGDYQKAKMKLGWEPSVCFEELVIKMMKNDISKIKQELRR